MKMALLIALPNDHMRAWGFSILILGKILNLFAIVVWIEKCLWEAGLLIGPLGGRLAPNEGRNFL